jgi:hypothetical protein
MSLKIFQFCDRSYYAIAVKEPRNLNGWKLDGISTEERRENKKKVPGSPPQLGQTCLYLFGRMRLLE